MKSLGDLYQDSELGVPITWYNKVWGVIMIFGVLCWLFPTSIWWYLTDKEHRASVNRAWKKDGK
jgi:hypothetical protein